MGIYVCVHSYTTPFLDSGCTDAKKSSGTFY
jgi:hypothetical protein